MKMNGDPIPKNPPFEKHGIVSILRSDFTPNPILTPFHHSSNSIRRTLSDDMSTQKGQHSNGFPPSDPPLKRVNSSIQLQALDPLQDHQDGNHGPAMEDVWSSIQAENKSWGGILSSPNNQGYGSDPGQVPTPYVHPLAKRSASSLSEKSLEICTESLGSETGSDGFSYPVSEPEESEQEEEPEVEKETEVEVYDEQVHQVVHNRGPTATLTSKRFMMVTATRPSFPPPLPSLGNREDGSNLHIRSHRRDGRLVVEAVSVPSPNSFRAQRQDGRLLLTFSKYGSGEDEEDDEYMQEEKRVEAAAEVEFREDEKGAVVDMGMKRRSCIQGTTMRNKFTVWSNKSATWPRHYNQTIIKPLHHHHHHHQDEDEEVDGGGGGVAKIAKQSWPSLPPRPITTKSTAVLNGYEYYWRRSRTTTTVGMLKPLANAGAQNHNKSTYKSEMRKLNPTKKNHSKLLYAAHSNRNNNNNNGKKGAQFCLEEAENLGKADAAAPRGGGGGAAEYGDVAPWMMQRGCKEAKKPSLLLWEPYCIATS